MCKIVVANEAGRCLSTLSVAKGTTWKRALAFMRAERELDSVRCVFWGTTDPVCMHDVVRGDCCIAMNVDNVSLITIAVAPRNDCERVFVPSAQPLKDALLPHVGFLTWSGEELVPLWDPSTNQYRDPLTIDTRVEDMVKPVRVLARVAKLSIDCLNYIEEQWPYTIQRVKVIGDGLWEVHSDDANKYIVRRGTHLPIERALPRPQHVRL